MRVRSVLSFGTGVAIGAAVMYLGDPAHGPERRVEARRWVLARGRQQAGVAAGAAARAIQGYALAAVEGYRESRVQIGA